MNTGNEPDPSATLPHEREGIVGQFEAAWRAGGRPILDEYAAAARGDRQLLTELVQIDLAHRLQVGEASRVETYLEHYPDLAEPRAAVSLIILEYNLRRRLDRGVTIDEYLQRFAQYRDALLIAATLSFSSEAAPGADQPTHAGLSSQQRESEQLTKTLDVEQPAPAAKAQEAPSGGSAESATLMEDTRPAAIGRYPVIPGYEIMSELGRGGMGVVYKARQENLKRIVALKMILTGMHASTRELARFRSEAESVARLQHANIVQVYEVGEQNGHPYFSLEFIDGGTLSGRTMPQDQALELIEKLARASHFAHLRGIVHRDLKPANVLLTSDGIPKITDFGLAKRLDDDITAGTRTGAIMGTPSYMAPEQATGMSTGPATDIYALGAILYELLTGQPPFRGVNMLDILEMVRSQEPPAPRSLQPKIHRDVETICLKCLQKSPRQRYASADELADDVRNFISGIPIKARPTPAWERAWKWGKRRPAVVTALALVLLAIAGAIGMAVFHVVDVQRQLDKARVDVLEATQGRLRAEIQESIRKSEAAFAAEKWPEVEKLLAEAEAKIGSADGFDELKSEIATLRDKNNPKLLDQEGYRQARAKQQQFNRLHRDAVFYGSLFTGMDAESSLNLARASAEKALQLYGVDGDNGGPPAVDRRFFSDEEKADISTKCYELRMVLADTICQEGSAKDDLRQKAQAALRALDGASRLGVSVDKAYHLRRARYLAMQGDEAAAARERQLADALKPSVALTFFWLGDEMFKQGDLVQASLEFENALRLQPDHFEAQYLLTACQLRLHRPAQAKAGLTACLSLRPDFLWLYSLRGFAHGELAEYDAAFADFQKALDRNPDAFTRYGILVNRGFVRMRQEKLDEAIADLRQAIDMNPKQYQAYVNLAEAYQKQGKLDEALKQLDRCVELQPEMAALYRNRARLQLLRKDDQAALRDFDKAISLGAGGGTLTLVKDYLERGRILYRAGNYKGALQSYDEVLKLHPENSTVQRLRAEAFLKLKDYKAAVQAFDEYLKVEKPDAAVHQSRALARAKLGNHPGAIEDYTRALALKPDSFTFAARGWTYVATNSLSLALRDFEEAIRLDGTNGQALSGRGYVRVKLGQYRPGVADAEEALRLGPETASLLDNVARTYAQAVNKLDDEAKVRTLNSQSLELRFQYQDRALKLLRKAVDGLPRADRPLFWKQYVQSDPDLEPIRRAPGFVELEAEFAEKLRQKD